MEYIGNDDNKEENIPEIRNAENQEENPKQEMHNIETGSRTIEEQEKEENVQENENINIMENNISSEETPSNYIFLLSFKSCKKVIAYCNEI